MKQQSTRNSALALAGLTFEERMAEYQNMLSCIERVKYLEMLCKLGASARVGASGSDSFEAQRDDLMIELTNCAALLTVGQEIVKTIEVYDDSQNGKMN